MSKTAFVLSGGGAKGAFQAGVMSQLEKNGVKPDVIYGASVGAINAAAMAYSDADSVIEHWKSVTGKSSALAFNWLTLLLLSDGIYNLSPLFDNYLSKVLVGTPHTEAVATVCNLETGGTEYISNMQVDTATFQRRVMGSGAIPIIMSPVDGYVDGGVRNQVPIRKALADGCTDIYVISCNPWTENPVEPYSPQAFWKFWLKFFYVGYRAIDGIMEHEVFYENIQYPIQEALTLKKAGGPDVNFTFYAPEHFLYDTLTFDPTLIANAISLGQTIQPLDLSKYFQV